MGLLGLVPLDHVGQGAPPTAHVAPGAGGPTRWTPGTLPVVPVQYRLPLKLSRWLKLDFLYINLHLRTPPTAHVAPGAGGPTRWTPGTLPVVPVQYRLPLKLSRWLKLDFLYINLHLRTILELLVTSRISSGTPPVVPVRYR